MAFKFQCTNCKSEIFAQYLNIGDKINCPHCGIEVLIPVDAQATIEESTLLKSAALEDTENSFNQDDIKIANDLLNDVWEEFKKIGDYGAFKSFEDLRQITGYTHWDIKDIMKGLDLPERKYGNYRSGLAKVAYLRGRLYAIMPDYNKAIAQYEKALELDTSKDWTALIKYYMGIAHEVRNKNEIAISCYQDVKDLIGIDDEMGMDCAKRIEKLKTQKSGCFIATAVYGSTDCDSVIILKSFRDEVLMTYRLGQNFIKLYYSISPSISKALCTNERLRKFTRILIIQPIVYLIRECSKFSREKYGKIIN